MSPAPRTRLALHALAVLLATLVSLALGACAPSARDTGADAAGAARPVHVAGDDALAVALPTPAAARPSPASDASDTPALPAEANDAAGSTAPVPVTADALDDRCTSDADCTVKDVGSCCGYSPRCLNQASTPDPAALRARCAKDGRVGTCGFREVSGCQCVSGHCAALSPPGGGLIH